MEPFVETLWPAGESGIISGQPECGKSWFAFEEGVCLAMGWDVLGRYKVPARTRVVVIEEEASNDRAAKWRVFDVLKAHDRFDHETRRELAQWFQVAPFSGLRLHEQDGYETLRVTVEATNAEVCYLDSFFRLTPGADLERSLAASLALNHLDRLEHEFGTRFRVVHHDTKDGRSLFGSQALRGWRRDGLSFSQRTAAGVTRIDYGGNNGAPVQLCCMVTEFDAGGRLTRITAADPSPDLARKGDLSPQDKLALERLLEMAPPTAPAGVTVTALASREPRMSDRAVRTSLKRLESRGLAKPSGTVNVGKTTAPTWKAAWGASSGH
jgi:AAA domain-containing protein